VTGGGPTAGESTLTVVLPPEAASASAAREFLRAALVGAGLESWADVAVLAISEVVTNAALHAHTAIEVLVDVGPERVRVEVRDYSSRLPVQRRYDEHATTGRGMALVAAITADCGVVDMGADGKIVWFEVREPTDELSEEDLLSAWDLDPQPSGDPSAAQVHNVALLYLPPTLYLAARQHHDALLRELVLYAADHDVPDADFLLADQARRIVADALDAAIEEAVRAGAAVSPLPEGHPSPLPHVPLSVDLHITVGANQGRSFEVLAETLDAAEALANEGQLLVYPGLPEIIEVRDWVCSEVIAQLAGVPPVPWQGAMHEWFDTDSAVVGGRPEPRWDPTLVRESDRGVVAADDTNRIIAVSRRLAELLGWEVEALVGRRVVTLVPRSFREAHVAGFSRHLSTGEAHVIGRRLDLPVLRADGSEVMCRFLIERAPTNPGRAVYVAWIEPLSD
jgi:PAS domain S-box-containing protein